MATIGGVAVGASLLSAYGTFGAYAGRFLYPARPAARRWLYVAVARSVKVGDAIDYKAPDGARVTIARQRDAGDASDFIALSSVCPHLGCAVHWEGQNDRFFCPCHNGVFDPQGVAVSGPPADAGQDLKRFGLKIENGLLFIEVAVEMLSGQERSGV